MTNSKSTKRAFVSSAIAVIMCVAMLIGTTFAWFTDTASTAVNKIQSGTLDLEVEYTLDGESWEKLDGATDLFGEGLFEPGYTRVVAFRVSNNGNLALKYRVGMNIVSETKGINKAGEEFALSDYLKVKASPVQAANYIGDIMVNLAFDRDSSKAIGWTDHNFKDLIVDTDANGREFVITAGGEAHYFIMQVYMPETVGNEANAISEDKAPSIEFGVNFVATQATIEYDSYDNQYDKNATYPDAWDGTVASAEALAATTDTAAKTVTIDSAPMLAAFANAVNSDADAYAGYTITLTSNINLGGQNWTPINMTGENGNIVTFDGNGKTISNFTVNGDKQVGLFGTANFATVKNLTVDNAVVTGINHAGAIVGHGMVTSIDNCTVKNSSITVSVANNDDGDKAGAIIGWTNEGICNITNCTVENCTVTGYRDIAGIVGYYGTTGGVGQVSGNTVKDSTIIQDLTDAYQSGKPTTVGSIVGRSGDGFTLDTASNTATNVTIK